MRSRHVVGAERSAARRGEHLHLGRGSESRGAVARLRRAHDPQRSLHDLLVDGATGRSVGRVDPAQVVATGARGPRRFRRRRRCGPRPRAPRSPTRPRSGARARAPRPRPTTVRAATTHPSRDSAAGPTTSPSTAPASMLMSWYGSPTRTSRGVRSDRVEQPRHQRQRDHRGLVDDDDVGRERVVVVVAERRIPPSGPSSRWIVDASVARSGAARDSAETGGRDLVADRLGHACRGLAGRRGERDLERAALVDRHPVGGGEEPRDGARLARAGPARDHDQAPREGRFGRDALEIGRTRRPPGPNSWSSRSCGTAPSTASVSEAARRSRSDPTIRSWRQ